MRTSLCSEKDANVSWYPLSQLGLSSGRVNKVPSVEGSHYQQTSGLALAENASYDTIMKMPVPSATMLGMSKFAKVLGYLHLCW